MSRVAAGIGASPGVAIGPVHVHRNDLPPLPAGATADPAIEIERLRAAVSAVTDRLSELEEATRAVAADGAAADIFSVHAMLLEDPELTGPMEEAIRNDLVAAERAALETTTGVASEFSEIDDEYFSARAADILDLGKQLVRELMGLGPASLAGLTTPSIIVADDLAPSETAMIPPGMALGFCTLVGSAVSHTAILARSMGIPAVVGIGEIDAADGSPAMLDGDAGTLVIDPSPETLAEARDRAERQHQELEEARQFAGDPASTLDGHLVEVVANVGNVEDAFRAVEFGAEGIGLVRTEFLFLDRDSLPTEDEQLEAYRSIMDPFPRGPVVMRTLDVGGDKQLPSVELPTELNPFLGRRGIRLTLAEPEIFRTQLRAILRAGAGRPTQIMFPMVGSLAEIRAARAVVDDVIRQLDAEGRDRATELEVGVMIEVPSAAVLADLLVDEVDFFSIGTNDLTQYTLAVDRTNPYVATLADALHPAVLRLVRQVVEAAHATGRWVGVCGELAGDPLATPILVGLGVDELSMSPPAIPLVKDKIRRISRETCRELARKCLSSADPAEVRKILSGQIR